MTLPQRTQGMRALAKQAPRTAGGLHQLPCSSEWRRTPVKAPAGAEGPAEATAGEVGGQPGHAPGERPFEGREVAWPLEPRVALAAGPARAPDSHLCPKSTGLVSFPSCPWGSQSVRNHVGRGPTIQGQEGCRPPPLTRALAPPPAHPRIPGWTTQQCTDSRLRPQEPRGADLLTGQGTRRLCHPDFPLKAISTSPPSAGSPALH